MIIPTVNIITGLVRQYNLSNVKVIVAKSDNPYSGKISQTSQADKELYKSSLGTPVFTNLTFKAVTYTDLTTGLQIKTEDITLDTILITVSIPKIIVKTQIQGRNGSVKEYIGQDDYQVSINGIIVGSSGHYPAESVRLLKRMLDAPVAIPVVSDYLLNLDIHSLVVTDSAFNQEPGGYSKQNFTINCVSDTPIELQSL